MMIVKLLRANAHALHTTSHPHFKIFTYYVVKTCQTTFYRYWLFNTDFMEGDLVIKHLTQQQYGEWGGNKLSFYHSRHRVNYFFHEFAFSTYGFILKKKCVTPLRRSYSLLYSQVCYCKNRHLFLISSSN